MQSNVYGYYPGPVYASPDSYNTEPIAYGAANNFGVSPYSYPIYQAPISSFPTQTYSYNSNVSTIKSLSYQVFNEASVAEIGRAFRGNFTTIQIKYPPYSLEQLSSSLLFELAKTLLAVTENMTVTLLFQKPYDWLAFVLSAARVLPKNDQFYALYAGLINLAKTKMNPKMALTSNEEQQELAFAQKSITFLLRHSHFEELLNFSSYAYFIYLFEDLRSNFNEFFHQTIANYSADPTALRYLAEFLQNIKMFPRIEIKRQIKKGLLKILENEQALSSSQEGDLKTTCELLGYKHPELLIAHELYHSNSASTSNKLLAALHHYPQSLITLSHERYHGNYLKLYQLSLELLKKDDKFYKHADACEMTQTFISELIPISCLSAQEGYVRTCDFNQHPKSFAFTYFFYSVQRLSKSTTLTSEVDEVWEELKKFYASGTMTNFDKVHFLYALLYWLGSPRSSLSKQAITSWIYHIFDQLYNSELSKEQFNDLKSSLLENCSKTQKRFVFITCQQQLQDFYNAIFHYRYPGIKKESRKAFLTQVINTLFEVLEKYQDIRFLLNDDHFHLLVNDDKSLFERELLKFQPTWTPLVCLQALIYFNQQEITKGINLINQHFTKVTEPLTEDYKKVFTHWLAPTKLNRYHTQKDLLVYLLGKLREQAHRTTTIVKM